MGDGTLRVVSPTGYNVEGDLRPVPNRAAKRKRRKQVMHAMGKKRAKANVVKLKKRSKGK